MKKIIVFLLCLTMGTSLLFAQDIERNIKERLTDYFAKYTATAKISTPKLNSFDIDYDRRTIQIYASESFAYQPFLPETVETIYNQMKELLPGPVNYYQITIYADGKPIEELIPNLYRSKKKDKERMALNTEYKGAPWVKNTSRPNEISRGLQDRHIALWQSHGNYYKNDKGEWGWQRPRLFCTTEDMFTQSFILPYVIPMLENAGAIVYTPRERDTQKNEIIVDNDTPNASLYLEVGSKKARWTTTSVKGFAQKKAIYKDGENPFTDGTSRYIQTEKKKKKNKDQAFAEWVPTLPATGKYAVYVSYQTQVLSHEYGSRSLTLAIRYVTYWYDFYVLLRFNGNTIESEQHLTHVISFQFYVVSITVFCFSIMISTLRSIAAKIFCKNSVISPSTESSWTFDLTYFSCDS